MKKYLVWFELAGIMVIGLLMCIGLYWEQAAWKAVDIGTVSEDDNASLKWGIDQVITADKIEISGWVYKGENNTEYFDSAIVLKDIDTGSCYEIATAFVKRTDITDLFGEDKYNYDNSGFLAKADHYTPGKEYEICILYGKHGERILQSTGNVIKV